MGPLAGDGGVPGCLQLLIQHRGLVAGAPPIGTGRMAAGPHGELSGKGLWHKGSLGSSHLMGLGGRAGASGVALSCGTCPGGVSTQKQWCLGCPGDEMLVWMSP